MFTNVLDEDARSLVADSFSRSPGKHYERSGYARLTNLAEGTAALLGCSPRRGVFAVGCGCSFRRARTRARCFDRGVTDSELSLRVKGAAEAMLAEEGDVAPVDVLVRMGWLPPVRVDEWRQGRLPALERGVQANLHKLTSAMRILRRWARDQGLQPSQTDYVARTRDQRNLQFSVGGDPAIEKAYRTHWVSPDWSEAKGRRLAERQSKPPDLVVIDALGDWTCTECSGTGQLMLLEGPGPLCMACADLDHLVFLPRGDTALTRRAKKASSLSAVVIRFSRTRKRYERQGTLVAEEALARAEAECLADDEVRARRRRRDEERRELLNRGPATCHHCTTPAGYAETPFVATGG